MSLFVRLCNTGIFMSDSLVFTSSSNEAILLFYSFPARDDIEATTDIFCNVSNKRSQYCESRSGWQKAMLCWATTPRRPLENPKSNRFTACLNILIHLLSCCHNFVRFSDAWPPGCQFGRQFRDMSLWQAEWTQTCEWKSPSGQTRRLQRRHIKVQIKSTLQPEPPTTSSRICAASKPFLRDILTFLGRVKKKKKSEEDVKNRTLFKTFRLKLLSRQTMRTFHGDKPYPVNTSLALHAGHLRR